MKTRLLTVLFVSMVLFSCKDSTKETTNPETTTEVAEKKSNVITLSNYSDENWKNGIGITYKMFLTDYSKEKEALLTNAKELVLADGKTVVPIVGSEVKGGFIQIYLKESGTNYSAMAEYPNEITVK